MDPFATPIEQQYAVLHEIDAEQPSQASLAWALTADSFESIADLFDTARSGSESVWTGQAQRRFRTALGEVVDALDDARTTALINARALDDLATDITIAQARMETIWTEYVHLTGAQEPADEPSAQQDPRAVSAEQALGWLMGRSSAGNGWTDGLTVHPQLTQSGTDLEFVRRQFQQRAAREVWGPFSEDLRAAASRLRPIQQYPLAEIFALIRSGNAPAPPRPALPPPSQLPHPGAAESYDGGVARVLEGNRPSEQLPPPDDDSDYSSGSVERGLSS